MKSGRMRGRIVVVVSVLRRVGRYAIVVGFNFNKCYFIYYEKVVDLGRI